MEGLIYSLPALPIFFAMFIMVYLLAYFGVFRNWSPNLRPEASSCLISLAHGTPAVILASYAVAIDSQRGFAAPNTDFQNAVLDFSIAYFLTDLLHYLVFYPSDVLFILHHLATLFVFITCGYAVSHGAFSVLVLLILAEITSACQNTWTLASARRADVPMAAKLYEKMSLPFYAYYTVVRGFAGPVFVYQMGVFYLGGKADDVIPRWISTSWIVVVAGAITLSMLWVGHLWLDLYRQQMKNGEKKVR